jgi:hypothetical protein
MVAAPPCCFSLGSVAGSCGGPYWSCDTETGRLFGEPALQACTPFLHPTEPLETCGKCRAGRAGLSLRVVVEAFIPQAGMRSFKKSRDRWEFADLPLLRSLHAKDPNDTR